MRGRIRTAAMAAATGLGLLAGGVPGHAQAVDRSRLESLIVKAEKGDPTADPQAYHAGFLAALDEAQRLYPASHPEVAARQVGVATALAALSKFDEAKSLVASQVAVLEKAGAAYGLALGEALSLQAYIATFQGDHPAAIAASERAVALHRRRVGARPDKGLATELSNLAAIYSESGRPERTLELNAEAIAMARALDPIPPDVVVWTANRMVYLRTMGQSAAAIEQGQAGLALGEKLLPADHPLLANLYANLAALLREAGRPSAAIPLARRAFEAVEKANGGPNQNSAAMRAIAATAMIEAGRYADGAAFLEAALPILDAQLGSESNRAQRAREVFARALLRLGRGDEALALQRAVIEVSDRKLGPLHRDRMIGRVNLAQIALARGDNALAEGTMRDCVALRAAAVPPTHPDLLAERALLLLARSRNRGAGLGEEARRLLRTMVDQAGLDPAAPLTQAARGAFGHLAEVLLRAGDTAGAFEAQQWSARTSVDDAAAAAAAERSVAKDPELQAALAARRRLLVERQGLLASLEAQLGAPKEGFDLAATNSRLAEIERQLAGHPLRGAGFVARPLATVRAGMAPGEMFVLVSELADDYAVTALSRAGQWQYLTGHGSAALRARVETLRRGLDPLAAADRAFDRPGAAALFSALFRPEVAAALDDSEILLVAANGAFGALPFAVLAPTIRGDDFLIDRLAIVRRAGAPGHHFAAVGDFPPPRLVAFGDVAANPGPGDSGMRSALTGLTLPSLPSAAAELAGIARAIGDRAPTILMGRSATEEALRSAHVATGDVLAFATHGLVSGEVEGLREPALVLSPTATDDGLLTAGEIGRLNLPAGWVILSACNTAAAGGPDDPGLSGLSQAFILAGAERILATHWLVRDDVAAALSTATLVAVAAGSGPAEALRRAITDQRRRTPHPALWGAFEIVMP